jgi:geranylgeranyl reductase family protein
LENYDVIVVGAGPAGLSTALHLRQYAPVLAMRTLVLEKARHPRPKLCGGGITVRTAPVLQGLGLSLDVPSFPVRSVCVRFEGMDFWLRDTNPFHVVQRYEFDAFLANVARKRGIRLQEGEPVLGVSREDGAVLVRTGRGVYKARVVVGADGANSLVRRSLGFREQARISRLLEIVTPADPASRPELREGYTVLDFSAGIYGLQGYVWHFPCLVNGQTHMNWGVFNSQVLSSSPHLPLKEILGKVLREQKVDAEAWPLKGHPLRWFDGKGTYAVPHILLVGDAAGVDPLLGEGISYSLEYGQVAARELEAAFTSGDFSFAGYRARILVHRLGRDLLYRARWACLLYRLRSRPLVRLGWRLAGVWYR